MRSLTRLCYALAVALPLGLMLFPARGAAAAAFTVDSLADTPDAALADGLCADAAGACTLREDARDERVALSRVRRAEMVRAFLLSAEYRGRFQGDPSRGAPSGSVSSPAVAHASVFR